MEAIVDYCRDIHDYIKRVATVLPDDFSSGDILSADAIKAIHKLSRMVDDLPSKVSDNTLLEAENILINKSENKTLLQFICPDVMGKLAVEQRRYEAKYGVIYGFKTSHDMKSLFYNGDKLQGFSETEIKVFWTLITHWQQMVCPCF